MFEEKLSSLPQILHPVCPMPSHAHLEHLPEKERELTLTRAARAEQTPLSALALAELAVRAPETARTLKASIFRAGGG